MLLQMVNFILQTMILLKKVYKNASESQKRIIVDMVVEKQINNEQIDANILISLGKLCGMDLIGIEPLDKEG